MAEFRDISWFSKISDEDLKRNLEGLYIDPEDEDQREQKFPDDKADDMYYAFQISATEKVTVRQLADLPKYLGYIKGEDVYTQGDLVYEYPNSEQKSTFSNPHIKENVKLEGSPTTTTQVKTDSSTKIATTEYVKENLKDYIKKTDSPATGDITGTYENGLNIKSSVQLKGSPTLATSPTSNETSDNKIVTVKYVKDVLGSYATITFVNNATKDLVNTNDSRLSNSRTPTGAAGGDLTGNYPSPTIKADVALSGKPTAPGMPDEDSSGIANNRLVTKGWVNGKLKNLVSNTTYATSSAYGLVKLPYGGISDANLIKLGGTASIPGVSASEVANKLSLGFTKKYWAKYHEKDSSGTNILRPGCVYLDPPAWDGEVINPLYQSEPPYYIFLCPIQDIIDDYKATSPGVLQSYMIISQMGSSSNSDAFIDWRLWFKGPSTIKANEHREDGESPEIISTNPEVLGVWRHNYAQYPQYCAYVPGSQYNTKCVDEVYIYPDIITPNSTSFNLKSHNNPEDAGLYLNKDAGYIRIRATNTYGLILRFTWVIDWNHDRLKKLVIDGFKRDMSSYFQVS